MGRKTVTVRLLLVGLVLVIGFLVWRVILDQRQIVTAYFISAHCETVERTARDNPDPDMLAHQVEFLIGYYQGHIPKLYGTRLVGVVRRDYEHTLTNALIAYAQVSTNDLHSQIQEWSEQYAQ